MKYLKIFAIIFVVLCVGFSASVKAEETPAQDKITQKYGITIEEEKEIGFQSAIALVKKYGHYKNAEVNDYVTKIGENIAKKVSVRPDIKYRFIVLNTNDVNAFAAPGGYVFITKGALKVIYNEAELAALLSHEITHVEKGHGLDAIYGDSTSKSKIKIIRQSVESDQGLDQNFEKLLDEELSK